MRTDRGGGVGHHQWIGAAVAEAQPGLARERVIGAHDRAEHAGMHECGADPCFPRQVEGEAEIGVPRAHGGHDLGAAQNLQFDACARMRRAETLERRRHDRARRAAHHGHGDLAAPQPLHCVDQGAGTVVAAAAFADVVEQDFAGGGELQASRQALEQRGAEFLLEGEDLAIDRGGGNVERGGRFADRAAAGNLVDIAHHAVTEHRAVLRCLFGIAPVSNCFFLAAVAGA